jgi:hypothetical protein
VSSFNCSRHPISDSSHCCSTSATASDKTWVVSSATSQARCTFASSPSSRAIFQTRLSVSSRVEASATTLSASTLDTFPRASLSIRAAQSSASLTHAAALPCRNNLLSISLHSKYHYNMGGLRSGGGLPRLGHLCPQCRHVRATPSQVLQKQRQEVLSELKGSRRHTGKLSSLSSN